MSENTQPHYTNQYVSDNNDRPAYRWCFHSSGF